MAHPRPPAHNGPPGSGNHNQGPQPAANKSGGENGANPFTRPFTLFEALPYTPFTTIVSFDSAVLPAPTIGSASPAPSLNDIVPSQDFDALNQEGQGLDPPSKRFQQTVNQVQHLLERGNITEFKFKTGPKGGSNSPASRPSSSLASGLSSLSKMVYDQTVVPFRYPTPDTPTATSPNAQTPMSAGTPVVAKQSIQVAPVAQKQNTQATASTDQAKQISNAQKNKQAHAQNAARFKIVLPTKSQLEQASSVVKPLGNVSRNAAVTATATATTTPTGMTSATATTVRPSQISHQAQSSQPPRPSLHPKPVQPPQLSQGLPSTPPPVHHAEAKSRVQPMQQIKLVQPVQPPLPSPQAVRKVEESIVATPKKSGSQAPPSSANVFIAIELPHAAAFNKSEYLLVPDELDEPINLSARKRKRDDLDQEDLYGESLDLRQRADAAYHDLKVFLQNVYEADDHASTHRAGNDFVFLTAENETTLTSAGQAKAQTLLGKTISLNCFKTVPLGDLLHLLRLSEGALKQAESLEMKIEESMGATDIDHWIEQLPNLDNAIKAARTSLRMMCGGREEKQLYSEDTIDQSLNLFKRVMDGIVIPIAELRPSENTSELFRALSSHKKRIASLFTDCQKLFSLMSDLISKTDTSETVTNTLEFAACRLIFMETAHVEKDSILDTQKFDGLRLVAMDMLSQIFLLNPAQRQGIFDEILTSLEKLPLGKRARTFKLVDGSSIQPVSALIMRLVQTSAGKVDGAADQTTKVIQSVDALEDDAGDAPSGTASIVFKIRDEAHAASQHSNAIRELEAVSAPLMTTALQNASYVVSFIVNRALKSTKSGDTPYRNLLDLFVEDFTSCLDNPDWPAAELLLRLLMGMMRKLVDGDKSGVPAKNMGLELLGIMGAAISKLRGHVRKTASALDTRDAGDLGIFLSDLAAAALELKSRPEHMVSWTGPYRATLEYLESRFSEDRHLGSAISFIVSDWGAKICAGYDSYEEDFPERDQEFGRLAFRLREMIQDRRWLSNEYSFKDVTPSQARLSYTITLLRSPLCENFNGILNLLLGSMASDQPTVRSKSLKSINQVLETDPSILDGDSVVVKLILQCSNDSSTQVRDSALGLIGKCIGMRPALEEKMTGTVVDRFIDAGPGVRKRAMKLAKDIYLRNHNKAVRSAIANGLLHRVQDPEESVRDLARQIIEEIWFMPFHNSENSAISQISLADHVALMVQTVKQGNITNVLDKVLQTILAPDSKTAQASLQVCAKFVATMFDLVDNPDSNDPSVPSGRDALQVLMIFAKADASLFTFEQLRLLKPYITSIASSDDLAVSRAVVVIYRRVLPQLSSAHDTFLAEVRAELMPTVSKVTRTLLDDIMACLWIISTLRGDSEKEKLARLLTSVIKQIQKLRIPLDPLGKRQFARCSLIVGMTGKHCNLDGQYELFKRELKSANWTGTSVSKLMVDIVVPFSGKNHPLAVRKDALDSVGLVCQSSPRNYVSTNVYNTFQTVFNEQIPSLESMVLRSFKEFLFAEEQRSERASEAPATNGAKSEKKRELTVIGGTSYDDVASATTQRFLKEIGRIATSTQDDHAFLAVEVLASINRQGLVHPKETGVTFITLETSSNPRISELAFLEHKALHAKHETVIEREYVKAIQSAFAYQRDIAKDPRGATTNPFTPKLHLMMEVLKISKSRNRQKFLDKFCAQVDFDVAKLELGNEDLPPQVQYSRFIMENLAFFEFLTVGELQFMVSAMEKLVTSTGATVAQAIESEVFQVRVDNLESNPAGEGADQQAQSQPSHSKIDNRRLRQLTAGSMILLMVWEVRSYLRRLYNMGTGRREQKAKAPSKDLSRAPTKAQNVTGDKLWEEISVIMTAFTSRERMIETCKAFVELMNVDKEFLVQDEDDETNGGEGPTTPGNDEDDDPDEPSTAGRGHKRKAVSSATPAGRKKRARSSSQQSRRRGRPKKNSIDAQQDAEGDFDDVEW
ncbi:hypothetical protein B0H63DRAFT_520266 [Podospora didyma]|uniref:Sister chromatid cohesion protein n=1 Tax=Podospora didyma TaxID=330526 RepID=A0AAE0U510_9PEZI|nr:hypothetical protein B0H63DRAFT_520266 [Podospora didyma]